MDELASFLTPSARLDVKLLALQQASFNFDALILTSFSPNLMFLSKEISVKVGWSKKHLISNGDGAEHKKAL